ncbi:hypothetical protein GCM10023092_10450 [Rurimicrobium arvi]|uniref:Gliding motility-associated C-terminal domain-containing protein n=2 Tax=Rurimicrobium arvi TaxID=2049916 RepID=A0ABP8MNW3_9BACT
MLSAVFFLLSSENALANRVAAAELAYKWVSDSTYLVTYTFYRDCGGSTEPANIRVCYFNTCNTDNGSVLLTKKTPLSSNGTIVDPGNGCTSAPATTCTSPATVLKGFRKWVYEGTVTLPSKCATWKFAVSLDARNAGSTNYAALATNNMYTEATLNNIDAPKSSSPAFSTDLIQYMCAGVPQSFNYAGVDADGDVLSYSLIDPQTASENQSACLIPPAPTSYAFGGSKPGTSLTTDPFPTGGTFNFGATSGLMTLTPAAASAAQQAMMTIYVVKRRGTKVVGTVMRDIQFIVNNGCTPNNVTFSITSMIQAFVNTAGRVQICPNVAMRVCFNIASTDGSVAITNVKDDHLTFSPTSGSSTITPTGYAGSGTNVVTGCLDWTPNETDQGVKRMIIESDVCRPGAPKVHRRDTITFHIVETLNVVATDTFICFGDTSYLCPTPDSSATGGTYTYSTTTSGTGFPTGSLGITTYPPCASVRPSSTTVYLVETPSIPGGCKRQDLPALNTNQAEMKIVVVNPRINAGPDTVMCIYDTLQMNSNLLNPQPELTYAYHWIPGTYLSDSTDPSPVLRIPNGVDPLTLPDSLVYRLEVTPTPGSECYKEDTIVVHLLKGYYILTGDTLQNSMTGLGYKFRQKGESDTAICSGKSVVLQGWRDVSRGATNDSTYTYTWNPPTGVSTPTEFIPGVTTITPPGTDTGVLVYTLTASRVGCTDSVKRIVITVDKTPTVDIGPDKSICFGDTLNLFADINPSPDVFSLYKYKWYPGGALSRADTFVTYFTGYRSETIHFTVTTTRANCSATDSAVYSVNPRAFLTKGNDTSICPGDSATLLVAGDALLKTITWKPTTNIDSIHSLHPRVSPTFTTDYVVIGTDSNSCVDSASIKVSVFPRTVIYLPDSARIYPGDVIELSPEGNALYYTWFPLTGFLDYGDSSSSRPKIAPLLNTTYRLRAVSAAGCVAEDSIYVFVSPDSYVDMPNAFAPGRSGDNTTFKAAHLGDATLTSLKVFNRWGMLVFETTNIEEGWDGSYKGEPQPMGVYVYTVEAVTKSGKKVSKQGNVTLIR